MRYSVGDKVRVRKDLEVGKWYGENYFGNGMGKTRGKTVTIEKKYDDCYWLKETSYWWNDEMLEPVEDIIEYKGKKYDVKEKHERTPLVGVHIPLNNQDLVLCLVEHKEEILDEEEKEYLRAVIRPFRDKVNSILKSDNMIGYFIAINTYGSLNNVCLPEFKDKRMYKGMELDKEYTLDQLGL